jgi:pimeloyl-ACP methyl ester carboxylesterase
VKAQVDESRVGHAGILREPEATNRRCKSQIANRESCYARRAALWLTSQQATATVVHRYDFRFTIHDFRFTICEPQLKRSHSEFHDVRGLRYHVRTWGESRARKIFLLHGWMDVSASFQFLVDCFEREWHVIAPDWRGFGLTEWAREGYWFPDYYADLDALLNLYQPDSPVLLVGHSMGGNIAGTYSGLRPERIAKLVTLEGLGMRRSEPAAAPKRIADWLDAQIETPRFATYGSFAELAARLKRNNPRLPDDKAEFLAREWGQETADGTVELRSDPRHKAANPYLYRIDETIACWRRITAPVLLVNGRDSHIRAWLKDHPEQFAERKAAFRDLREVELEDCGHMMHHDQPRLLARLIESFVSTQSP